MRGLFSFILWLYPGVEKALEELAKLTNININMPYDSQQTIALLLQLRDKYVALQEKVTQAQADLEPLRAENSRINTVLARFEAEDAAEDATLAEVDAVINPQTPPPVDVPPTDPQNPVVDTPPADNTPVDDL